MQQELVAANDLYIQNTIMRFKNSNLEDGDYTFLVLFLWDKVP